MVFDRGSDDGVDGVVAFLRNVDSRIVRVVFFYVEKNANATHPLL